MSALDVLPEVVVLLVVGLIGSTTSLVGDYRPELCEFIGGTYVEVEGKPLAAVPDQCPDGRWSTLVGLEPDR